jgi:hypothetical protein
MEILNFEERNRNSYKKVADVPLELINKYRGLLPDELITIWKTMGFGIYEDGFIQLVNPDEYEFVFDGYVDKMYEPSIIWAITALGDMIMWEGRINCTIPNAGNYNTFINIRKCTDRVIGTSMEAFLYLYLGDRDYWRDKDYFAAKPYFDIKGKLPALEYGQCYGYVPAIALGGSASVKNLKIVDAKNYIDIIGQAVGKIIDLS